MKGVTTERPSQAICNKNDCGFQQTWSNEAAAQAAACWHVFTAHPKDWETIMGHVKPPQDPRPDELGEWLV